MCVCGHYAVPMAGLVSNGFHNPIHAESVIREPKDAPPPTLKEVDLMSEFLHRVEPSLWDAIKSSIVSCNDLTLGRVCTNRGEESLPRDFKQAQSGTEFKS